MAQDPFDRQEFQRKLDAIARQTTGDQFRLNTKDPQASEKFGSFLADEQESFGQQNQPEARPDIGSFFGSGIIENLGRGATGIGRYLQENSPLTREGGFTAGEGISGGLRQSISGLGPNFAAAAPGVEPFIPESFVKGEGFERGLREGIRGFSHPQELLITAETAGIGPGVAAAIRGGGSSTFRNIAAKLLEPVSGGFGRRAGFEGGAGLGANIGGSVVQETLPEDTSTPVRLAATLAGGLVGGGVGAVGGLKAVDAGARISPVGVADAAFIPDDINNGPLRVFISAEQAAKGSPAEGLGSDFIGSIPDLPMNKGNLIAGRQVTKEQIPPTIFHVTSDLDRVSASGVLRAAGREGGGLGGGAHAGTVSFTSNRNDAINIATELRRVGEVARAGSDDEAVEIIRRIAAEDIQKAKLAPEKAKFLNDPEEIISSIYGAGWRESKTLRRTELYNAYLTRRESVHRGSIPGGSGQVPDLPNNPVLILTDEQARRITSESVGIITVPSRTLPTSPLITDRVAGDFLNEIQVHGDVDISGSNIVRQQTAPTPQQPTTPATGTAAARGAGGQKQLDEANLELQKAQDELREAGEARRSWGTRENPAEKVPEGATRAEYRVVQQRNIDQIDRLDKAHADATARREAAMDRVFEAEDLAKADAATPATGTTAARGAGDVPEPTFSGIGSGDHVQRTRADRIKALASGKIPKNFVEDLNIFSDRVYRESDASEALRVIGGGDTQPMSEIFTSNTPELALGQGTNKGVLIEYSTEGLKGRPDFTKPASRFSAEQSGTAEIVIKNRSTSSLKDNVLSITIDPAVADARELRTLMRSLAEPDELGVGDLGGRLRGQFDRETLPDGKIRFTPKQAAAQAPSPQQAIQPPVAASGAGGGRGFKVTNEEAKAGPDGSKRFTVSNDGSSAVAMVLSPDENGKVIGSIVNFETSPELRRQGFGEALVVDTMEELRRRGATSFEVYAEPVAWNKVTKRNEQGFSPTLFGKLGFELTGRKNKFGDREMVLDLIKGPEEVVLPEGFNLQAEMAKTSQRTLDDIIKNEPEVAREMGLLDPTTPATSTAAARQVTPQQQAIIDDVGTGVLPADDVAVDALDAAPVGSGVFDEAGNELTSPTARVSEIPGTAELKAQKVVPEQPLTDGRAGGSGPPNEANRPTADADFPESSRTALFRPAPTLAAKDDPLIKRAAAAIKATKPATQADLQALAKGRKVQIARAGGSARKAESFSDVGGQFQKGLGGEIARPEFESIAPLFQPEEIESLLSRIWGRGSVLEFKNAKPGQVNFRQFNADIAFKKLFHPDSATLPTPFELELLERVYGSELIRAVLSKKKFGQKAWDIAMDLWNLPRSLLATGDISATARQAAVLGPGNPKQFKDAFKSQIKAFMNEEYALASREAMEADEDFLRYTTKSGRPAGIGTRADQRLHIGALGQAADLSRREEAFMTRIAGRLPLVRNSERAFVTMLNELRFSVMKRMVKAAETASGGPATDEQLDAISAFINYATGRGSLGKAEGAAPLLNGLGFSPRLALSRFQLPLPIFTRAPNVRKKFAQDLTIAGGSLFTMLWLADKSDGIDVEVNPLSSDFGKMRIGKTRLDFGAGNLQAMRFLAQVVSGKKESIATQSQSEAKRTETVGRFLRTKAHPSLGLVLDVSNKEDFLGDDFTLEPEEFLLFHNTPDGIKFDLDFRRNPGLKTFTPMFVQDVVEAWKESGPLLASVAAIAAPLGIGVSSFGTVEDASQELWGLSITEVQPFQQELAKELKSRTSESGPGAFDQADIRQYDTFQDIVEQFKAETIDKRTAVSRYFSTNTFYSGLRQGLSAGIFGGDLNEESVFPKAPSGGTDAEKAALQEYYDSSAPFESLSGFNSEEWEKVLKILERKWNNEGTLEYVLANTHMRPIPEELIALLPDKTVAKIRRSSDARERFLRTQDAAQLEIDRTPITTPFQPEPTQVAAPASATRANDIIKQRIIGGDPRFDN